MFTNTTPVDAYRGAGRPEATYVVERMMERYAHEIGRDVLGVRRRNFVRPFKRGHDMPIGVTYDSGNYQGALAAALDKFDYQAFRQEQRAARSEGKLLGVGFSTYIEICGMAPSAVAGALGAGAGLWEFEHCAGPPDRHGDRVHRHLAARTRSRDHVGSDHVVAPRRSDGKRRSRTRRH